MTTANYARKLTEMTCHTWGCLNTASAYRSDGTPTGRTWYCSEHRPMPLCSVTGCTETTTDRRSPVCAFHLAETPDNLKETVSMYLNQKHGAQAAVAAQLPALDDQESAYQIAALGVTGHLPHVTDTALRRERIESTEKPRGCALIDTGYRKAMQMFGDEALPGATRLCAMRALDLIGRPTDVTYVVLQVGTDTDPMLNRHTGRQQIDLFSGKPKVWHRWQTTHIRGFKDDGDGNRALDVYETCLLAIADSAVVLSTDDQADLEDGGEPGWSDGAAPADDSDLE